VLELASLDDVHDDVLSNDVEQVYSEPREGLENPRTQNEPDPHSSSDVHVGGQASTVDLEASASASKTSPPQHFAAHADVHTRPQEDPLGVRSIPRDTASFLAMERLVQEGVDSGLDEDGDRALIVYEPHSNPNVQHDLDLWMRVREYDNANAEMSFTPVLSRKQKQQVRKNLQIGKPPPYKTRSQGGSNSGDK